MRGQLVGREGSYNLAGNDDIHWERRHYQLKEVLVHDCRNVEACTLSADVAADTAGKGDGAERATG